MVTLLFIANLMCGMVIFASMALRKGETTVRLRGALYIILSFVIFYAYTMIGWPVLVMSLVLVSPEAFLAVRRLMSFVFGDKSKT